MIPILLALAVFQTQPTVNVTLQPTVPFEISFRHDALLMPNFRWWCDGAIVKNFSTAETREPSMTTKDEQGRFLYTVTVPGLSAGKHVCYATSYNLDGETKTLCSATVTENCITPLVLEVGTPKPIGKPPAVPVDVRLVVKIGGGA